MQTTIGKPELLEILLKLEDSSIRTQDMLADLVCPILSDLDREERSVFESVGQQLHALRGTLRQRIDFLHTL